jgi:hypothetical protein
MLMTTDYTTSDKIQEIQTAVQRPSQPKYTLIVEPPDGTPEFIVLEISLPGVVSFFVLILIYKELNLLLFAFSN